MDPLIKRVPSLSQQVYDQLRQDILDSTPGFRLQNERDLALHFKVSRPTVRIALAQLADEGYLERRQGGGTFVTDKIALRTVAVLYYHTSTQFGNDNFYGTCFATMQKIVHEGGHRLEVVCNNAPMADAGPPVPKAVNGSPPDALAALGIMDTAYTIDIAKHNLPILTIDYTAPEVPSDSVLFDSFGAGQQMTGRLLGLGHERILFIGAYRGPSATGQTRPESDSLRLKAGYEFAMKDHGIEPNPGWYFETTVNRLSLIEDTVRPLLDGPERITAAVCFRPRHAQRLIELATEAGYSGTENFSVCAYGVDENENITGMRMDPAELGEAAGKVMLARLADEAAEPFRTMVVPGHFEPGATIAACKS